MKLLITAGMFVLYAMFIWLGLASYLTFKQIQNQNFLEDFLEDLHDCDSCEDDDCECL